MPALLTTPTTHQPTPTGPTTPTTHRPAPARPDTPTTHRPVSAGPDIPTRPSPIRRPWFRRPDRGRPGFHRLALGRPTLDRPALGRPGVGWGGVWWVVRVVGRAVLLGLVAVVVGVGTVGASVLFAPAAVATVPVPVDTADNSARTPLATRYADNRAAMLARGAPYAGWATPDRQFLLFDPRGDGLLAEVFGDLSSADRIAVLVPGVDTRGTNFVTGLGGVAERAPAVQAEHLYDAMTGQPTTDLGTGGWAGSAGPRLAVVAWLGYQTPHGVGRDAAREELARAGAVALERFVGGLARLRPHAAITVIGHSYGSTVVGLAAAHLPRQVTDLVAIGSPGMGVDRAAGLHTTARIWAALSPRDWIRWVPGVEFLGVGHGTQPADPSFGARTFATTGVTNHDTYLAPGTASLTSIAAIADGHPQEVTR